MNRLRFGAMLVTLGLVAAACSSVTDSTPTIETSITSEPVTTNVTETTEAWRPVLSGVRIPVMELDKGDCFSLTDDEYVEEVFLTACSEQHEAEVFEVLKGFPDFVPNWDRDQELEDIEAAVRGYCLGSFEAYIGIAADQSTLQTEELLRLASDWTDFTKNAVCFIYIPAGGGYGEIQTESFKNSRR